MLKKSLFWGMTAILLTASFGLMGCEQESPKSGDKSIIAFSINNVEGIIDENAKLIAVTLPSGNDLTKLSPVVVISSSAHIINPGTDEAIDEAGTAKNERKLPEADFTNGKSYVVKAEDGSRQTYGVEVTVRPAVVLQSLSVTVSKTTYAYNEPFDNSSLIVTGTYSDGAKKQETVGKAEDNAVLDGYDKTKSGTQNLTVSIGDVFTIFQVTVQPAKVLQSLDVTVLKTTYAYNEEFDNNSLIVTGTYSDGSKRKETVGTAEGNAAISGYDKTKSGTQNLTVTIGNVFTTFQVTVQPERTEQEVVVSIALPHTATEPVVYGIPEGGIVLSRFGATPGKPDKVLISVDGTNLWTNINWYIDGTLYTDNNQANNNIIQINANGWTNQDSPVVYTLVQPHTITFTGTKGGVEYSKTITFTVVK